MTTDDESQKKKIEYTEKTSYKFSFSYQSVQTASDESSSLILLTRLERVQLQHLLFSISQRKLPPYPSAGLGDHGFPGSGQLGYPLSG